MSRAAEFLNGSFAALRAGLDQGEVSATDLTQESLRRAQVSQPELNAFISIASESALAEAARADHRLRSGERGGVLGVPVGVKDLILTRDLRTTAASRALENFVPPYDATVVARLRAAGAPIVGKLNLDEFAMGSSNETSRFGPCRNPWDVARVPGGSSGGSAACVAARIAPLALGTDTGGSIRQPASFCGITGLKPTYGRVSRYGVVAFASSLDQVGPMGVDAHACAALLEAIAGHDIHDATSDRRRTQDLARPAPAASAPPPNVLRGLRVGLPREYFEVEGLSPDVRAAVEHATQTLRDAGAELKEIRLPHTSYALATYYLVCTAEASSNLARYDGIHYGHRAPVGAGLSLEKLYERSRREAFGPEVRLRILLGTYALSEGSFDAYYKKASQVRALIRRDFEEAFAQCDVIAGPTAPSQAFALGEKTNDPLSMYLSDVFTLSANLAGIPALSLNAGYGAQSLPVGLQLSAAWWDEARLLNVASQLEKLLPQRACPYVERFTHEAPANGVSA